MNWKKISCLVLFLGFVIASISQSTDFTTGSKADTSNVNALLRQSKEQFSTDPDKAISLAIEARDMADQINFLEGKAFALKNIGLGYYFKGVYLESLRFWNESLEIFEQINDQTGIANLLNNIAAIYTQQGDNVKSLEYSLRSLKISEDLGDKLRILSALNTIGTIYYNTKSTREKALDYLLRALPLCEELGDNEALGTISENIGEIYYEKNDFEKSLVYYERSIKALNNSANSSFAYNGIGKLYLKEGNITQALNYHNKALAIAEEFQSKPNEIQSLQGLANIYTSQNDYSTALVYYNRSRTIAEEIKAVPELKDIYKEMAVAYSKIPDYKNAFKYRSLYADIKDTLYNIETDKKLGGLQFEFDLEKKQGEINLLTKDKELTSLELKRQKFAKNASMVGLGLVFLIALLIYRNYRAKVKTHKILDRQKGEIEGLLLNILPVEIAKELQEKGHADPRNYDSVSVMFTDFKGFTVIADKVPPEVMVAELNTFYKAFDDIIEKHKIEKIKTIGDSYMCAGGIPTPYDNHVENMVKASLEINEFVLLHNQNRIERGLAAWELRLGIHVGPVVAGVVGKKKYAYDIWGSTVNIASRMESSSIPGKVNISSSVYENIKDKYKCTYRGKINAKNVGDVDMYFLEYSLNKPEDMASKDLIKNEIHADVIQEMNSK